MLSALTSLLLTSATVLAGHNANGNSMHRRVASNRLERRGYGGQATWFDVGLGSCGGHSSPGDFVVALDQPLYDGGSHCGETINICAGDKCTDATIVDLCPECAEGSLDMSKGLFQFFRPLGAGVFQMQWTYGSGKPKPKPQPKPEVKKPEPKPEPTTTHTHTTTHTTPKETPTPTSTDDKTSTKATPTSSTADPKPTDNGGNLDLVNLVLNEIGNLIWVAGAP